MQHFQQEILIKIHKNRTADDFMTIHDKGNRHTEGKNKIGFTARLKLINMKNEVKRRKNNTDGKK